MSFNKKSFFYAQCGCVLLVLIALILLPGASMVPTLLAIVGVWGVVSMCYKMLPWKCNAGWWTLLISSTILAIGVIANVNYYTVHSGATTQMPVLHNPDAWRYYADALSVIGHESGVPCEIKSHG